MTVAGTRVLKMHTDAAKRALRDNLPDFIAKRLSGDDLARAVAEAVVTAADGTKTYYVAAIGLPDGHTMIFGPLATRAAAERVLHRGDVVTQPGSRTGIWPLLPPTSTTKRKG